VTTSRSASFSGRPPTKEEQALIELTRWLSRALQYSPTHPLCTELATRTSEAMRSALADIGLIEAGVLRDKLVLGQVPTSHPLLQTRLGPYLHERGVILLRIVDGVRLEELSAFVDLLIKPAAELFSAGGLRSLLKDRQVAHVQVDEIAHELSNEERDRVRREDSVRSLFREMLMRLLARGAVPADLAAHIVELADHPDLAVRVIQGGDLHVNLAEAVAGFAIILLEEEQRRGEALLEKMGPILMQFSAESRDKILLGFPPLVGDFRQALVHSFSVLDDAALARFAFPSLLAHPRDLEATLYAIGLAAPQEERTRAVARHLAGALYDLNLDDRPARTLLATLAEEHDDAVSFAAERALITGAAIRIREKRVPLHRHGEDELVDARAFAPDALDRLELHAARDVVVRSSRMVDFDKFCASLNAASQALATGERSPGVAGILLGLARVEEPRWREVSQQTLGRLARSGVSAAAVRAVEAMLLLAEDESSEDVVNLCTLLAVRNPEPVLDLLERSTSRKLRRTLIDVLAGGGPTVLPSVRSRLGSSQWFVTRNMVIVHARLGGGAEDLRPYAEHPNAQVRVEVLRALRTSTHDPVACKLVIARLLDRAPEVVQAARGTLAGMAAPPDSIQELERLAGDDATDADTRRSIVLLLGRSRLDVAAEALVRLMQPRGLVESAAAGTLREDVARALRHCPAPSAAARFEESLRSSVRRVRKACERAVEAPR
jgi:hypothetical protein